MAKREHVVRKLTAILAADVVGYSRLMGADEVGTLRALKAVRKDEIDPVIAAHGGRIVKTTGDGLLADFPSVVEAVACAVNIQRRMGRRNRHIAGDQRIVLRIGINIGDIIIEGDDIFGDGVNVAARLESICEPGGLCISDSAHDQVRGRLPLAFADGGEQRVKNIARPIRVFALGEQAVADAAELPNDGVRPAKARPWRIIAASLAILLVAAGAAGWWALRGNVASDVPAMASHEARPSIAVLPLVTLADDAKDDYFADGLTEDVITALGRFSDLVVRSRNAVFAYKGKTVAPEEVGRALHVRYLVEGSVRRSPERIRISIRLTDAQRGGLLWSETYDVAPKDLFSVQDEITRRIAGTLASRLGNLELAKASTKPPSSLEAYDLVLRGRDLVRRLNRTANSQARTLLEKAIALDAGYAPAYVALGRVELNASNTTNEEQDRNMAFSPSAGAKLAAVFGLAPRLAVALRQPVLHLALVDPDEFGIEHAAGGLRACAQGQQRHDGEERQHASQLNCHARSTPEGWISTRGAALFVYATTARRPCLSYTHTPPATASDTQC